MSGPQIKGLLEETVKEYSKIKGIFTNINSLPDYSDNPVLIRSVEVIYENLNKIREEVVRFQGTLPPPTEGFNKSYKSPATSSNSTPLQTTKKRRKKASSKARYYCIYCGKPVVANPGTETLQVKCQNCGKEFTLPHKEKASPEKEALLIANTPEFQFVNKFINWNTGTVLLLISVFAWICYNIIKFKWGFEIHDSTKDLLIIYFIVMGFIFSNLGWGLSKKIVCESCSQEWLFTPVIFEGNGVVNCPNCSSILPIPPRLFIYQFCKLIFVIFPFYLTFLLAGPACCTVLGYIITNFIVLLVWNQIFSMMNR